MDKPFENKTVAQLIAVWADKLRDISASGLEFSRDQHDLVNYQAIQNIAMEMFSLSTGNSIAEIEPLRDPIFNRRTPLAMADAAVFDEAGQLLLIQRAGSGRWALPGGALVVGETPAEGVVREVQEETGIKCRPIRLVGVYDSQVSVGPSPQHQYNIVFLCHQLPGSIEEITHPSETLGFGWFAINKLPEPLEPSNHKRIEDASRIWQGIGHAYFDGME